MNAMSNILSDMRLSSDRGVVAPFIDYALSLSHSLGRAVLHLYSRPTLSDYSIANTLILHQINYQIVTATQQSITLPDCKSHIVAMRVKTSIPFLHEMAYKLHDRLTLRLTCARMTGQFSRCTEHKMVELASKVSVMVPQHTG